MTPTPSPCVALMFLVNS
ncbi:hypothetical protein E2C01_096173 [Portunus trituberculatus]|uniref:Uncharacterized protein n=1 Tax=Portunus trituberculatus TaxID=210409 RepID=A0A5B7JXA6_PORTR|nr:hypothetical protein [Portunus trituberculatus]